MSFTSCPPQCEVLPPYFQEGACVPVVQSGGISRIVIASCRTPDLSTLTLAEICDYARDGRIAITPELLAELPAAETTRSETRSCSPDTVTGHTQTLQFQSYNHDPVNASEYDFWAGIARNSNAFNFYFIGCDGWIYGPVPSPSFTVSPVIEPRKTGKAGFTGELSYMYAPGEFLRPFRINGIVSALTGGCVDAQPGGFEVVSPFDPTVTGTVGGPDATLEGLEITRTSCTQPIVVSLVDIYIISGGPNPPQVTFNNIPGPSGTTASASVSFAGASPGVYDFVYQLSGCNDTFTASFRVTVNPS